MRKLFWAVWYAVVGYDDSLTGTTVRWCRLNGVKFTDIKLEKTL